MRDERLLASQRFVEDTGGAGRAGNDRNCQWRLGESQPGTLGRVLIRVFDEWIAHDVGKVFVQMFESAQASWLGLPASLCIFAETCGNALALEHNGDLYSCDHFVEPRFRVGNIKEQHLVQLIASDR